MTNGGGRAGLGEGGPVIERKCWPSDDDKRAQECRHCGKQTTMWEKAGR